MAPGSHHVTARGVYHRGMTLIAQRYEIVRELGTGGTATVYEANDRVLARSCAVKVLVDIGQGRAADNRRQRLRTEAMALATLDHPRVVRVYDLGEHDGQPFLAMEYVEGGSLADRLLDEGPMRPVEAVDRLLEVLDALGAAHASGIVHRDVKPHNVLLRGDGTAALADFGIARQEERSHTRTGVALGSIDYMAPEQRVDARRVGPPADVYGAGCTLYHLLTAETPVDLYLSPSHSPRWEGVPAPLRDVVRTATAVDPGDRYHSAAEMAEALRGRRQAVASLPARQFAPPSGTPAPVPTRQGDPTVDEGRTKLEVVAATRDRDHHVGEQEYRWAESRRRVGQGSVVIGVGVAVVLSVAAFLMRPVVDDLVARTKARPVPAAAPTAASAPITGMWRGPFGGAHVGSLELMGDDAVLTGMLVLDVSGHAVRVRMVGDLDRDRGEVTLRAAEGHLTATLDPRGVLSGELQLGDAESMAFALVRFPDRVQ